MLCDSGIPTNSREHQSEKNGLLWDACGLPDLRFSVHPPRLQGIGDLSLPFVQGFAFGDDDVFVLTTHHERLLLQWNGIHG